jgi:hypothetical protein
MRSISVLLERLARAEVGRLRDHLARHLDVAVVLAGELADVGGGVVDDLAAEVVRDVLAADRDRGRGADVRLRRHREHVGRHADHRAGGVGAGTPRGDVDDHRDLGGEDALDDVAHRGRQPAGRVHLDHRRRVALLLRPLDRVQEVVLGDRVDVVLELGHEHLRRGVRRHRRDGEQRRSRGEEEQCPKGGRHVPNLAVRIRSKQGIPACRGRPQGPPCVERPPCPDAC